MAGGTVFRSRLVEKYILALDLAGQRVAALAAHIVMHPQQRELSALVMIKQRRLPLRAVVALRAIRHSVFRELLAVNIFMAFLTPRGCGLEIHVDQPVFQVGWPMAVHAGGGAMDADQREGGIRMVET